MQQKFVVSRRQVKRTQPFRPHRSRRRIVVVTGLSLLVVAVVVSAWGQRTENFDQRLDDRANAQSDSEGIIVESLAGPVAVRQGSQNRVQGSSSWLIRRPTIDVGLGGQLDRSETQVKPGDKQVRVNSRCSTIFPCRVALEVETAKDQQLVVRSMGTLSLEGFDGTATLEATDEKAVLISQTSGSLIVRAGRGGVAGFGILSHDIDVYSDGGPVDLTFAARPARL